jgi:hypothetical protein
MAAGGGVLTRPPEAAVSREGVERIRHWLALRMFDDPPPSPTLSGLELEYREAGRREARLAFGVGQATQDLGFRNELPVLFDCR